jgi:hypothetical protein
MLKDHGIEEQLGWQPYVDGCPIDHVISTTTTAQTHGNKMKGQNTTMKGTMLNVFLSLYVYDGLSIQNKGEHGARNLNPLSSHETIQFADAYWK